MYLETKTKYVITDGETSYKEKYSQPGRERLRKNKEWGSEEAILLKGSVILEGVAFEHKPK